MKKNNTLFALSGLLLSCKILFAQSLPYPALVGYWENWNNLALTSVDARYNVIEVAFPLPANGTDYNMNSLDFGPHSSSSFKAAIATLQGQGKKVLLSLGGATAPIYLDDVNQKNTFVSSVGTLLTTYGFDGIDIDLESSSLDFTSIKMTNNTNAGLVNMISAIQQILANYQTAKSKRCLLTMAPEVIYAQGGYGYNVYNSGAYLPIIEALRNDLDLLQVQLYNVGDVVKALDGKSYSEGSADFIVAMTEMIIKGFTASKLSGGSGAYSGLPESKVAVGLASCGNSASGYASATIRQQAINYLRGVGTKPGTYTLLTPGGYPNLGGMMTWSINEDLACNPSYGIASSFQTIFAGVGVSALEINEYQSFVLYPNPAEENKVSVDFGDVSLSGMLTIYNHIGQAVHQQMIHSDSKTLIDISSLAAGIYLVNFANESKKLVVK
jgi:chitinase